MNHLGSTLRDGFVGGHSRNRGIFLGLGLAWAGERAGVGPISPAHDVGGQILVVGVHDLWLNGDGVVAELALLPEGAVDTVQRVAVHSCGRRTHGNQGGAKSG